MNVTSPALIPRIWIAVLIVSCVILIIQTRNKSFIKASGSPKIVFIIIFLLGVYLVAMQWSGYYFITPVFILSTMHLLKYRNGPIMITAAFGFVLFSYLVFNQLLHIELPLGWWFV